MHWKMLPNTNIPLVALLSPMHLRNLPVRSEQLRIPMHPAMHSNMKPAGDSDLTPATLLASTGPFIPNPRNSDSTFFVGCPIPKSLCF